MAPLDGCLKDPEYANWVKSGLALNITNAVLRPFVINEIKKLHQSIVKKLPSGVSCAGCSVNTVCPNGICDKIQREIEREHWYPNPSFTNTCTGRWCTEPWEIAKCYMPPTEGCRNISTSDVDFTASINVIVNCKHFQAFGTNDPTGTETNFSKSRKFRNSLMHASPQNVSDHDMTENLNILINILNKVKTPETEADTEDAIKKIEKIKTNQLQLRLDDVIEVRRHTTEATCITDKREKGSGQVQRERLLVNFEAGCRKGLCRITEEHISKQEGNVSIAVFLSKINILAPVKNLCLRHQEMLFPKNGTDADIRKWDLFVYCFLLEELDLSEPMGNAVSLFVLEVKKIRDKILLDATGVTQEDLSDLCEYLIDTDLNTEIAQTFNEDSPDVDVIRSYNILVSWWREEEDYGNKQVSKKQLYNSKQIMEELDKRFAENNAMVFQKVREMLGDRGEHVTLQGACAGEIGAECELEVCGCDKKTEEALQEHITSPNNNEIGEHLNDFCHKLNVPGVTPVKGSIILNVTCSSITNVLEFWDSCIDGRAVEALSKVRDYYRRYFKCDTLEFYVILSKKGVSRCVNGIVECLPSHFEGLIDKVTEILASKETPYEPTEWTTNAMYDRSPNRTSSVKDALIPKDSDYAYVDDALPHGKIQRIKSTSKKNEKAMASLDGYLEDRKYANWVKSGLALNITNEVLRPFVINEIKKLHQSIVQKLPSGVSCTGCSVNTVCPNGICDKIQRQIEHEHWYHNPSFTNTCTGRWGTEPWEIAKCYMSPTEGCRNIPASDADFTASINVIINCKHFQAFGTDDPTGTETNFSKSRKFRNSLMHACPQKVSDHDMKKNLNILIDILNKVKTPETEADTEDAIKKIEKIKTNQLQPKLDDVIEVRKNATESTCIKDKREKGSVQVQIVPMKRLLVNFEAGCRKALCRLTEEHISKQEGNLSVFLSKINILAPVKKLCSRHKDMLFPKNGTVADIRDWDLFVYCFILELDLSDPIGNAVSRFVLEVKTIRDELLLDAKGVTQKDLSDLCSYLDDTVLKTEITQTFNQDSPNVNVIRSNNILVSWWREEEDYRNKQAIVQVSKMAQAKYPSGSKDDAPSSPKCSDSDDESLDETDSSINEPTARVSNHGQVSGRFVKTEHGQIDIGKKNKLETTDSDQQFFQSKDRSDNFKKYIKGRRSYEFGRREENVVPIDELLDIEKPQMDVHSELRRFPSCTDIKLFADYYVVSRENKITKYSLDSDQQLDQLIVNGAGRMCYIRRSSRIAVLKTLLGITCLETNPSLSVVYSIRASPIQYMSICHLDSVHRPINDSKGLPNPMHTFAATATTRLTGTGQMDEHIYIIQPERDRYQTNNCYNERSSRQNIPGLSGISSVHAFLKENELCLIVGCKDRVCCVSLADKIIKWSIHLKYSATDVQFTDPYVLVCVQDGCRLFVCDYKSGKIVIDNLLNKDGIRGRYPHKLSVHGSNVLVKFYNNDYWSCVADLKSSILAPDTKHGFGFSLGTTRVSKPL